MAARLMGAFLVTAVFCSSALAAESRLPTAEMLEFLADFETAGGTAVDPLQFASPGGEKKTVQQTSKSKKSKKSKKRKKGAAPAGPKGEKS